MSLRNQTLSGIGWSTLAKMIKQGAQFILSIFLMQLLYPEAYGLIGMAMVFIGFAHIYKEFGFGSALVQRRHLAQNHYSSVFYANIVIGILLSVLFLFIAPFLSLFYREPNLTLILQVLSVDFAIAGFGIVPKSILERKMEFDQLAQIEMYAAVIPGVLAVTFAFLGFGVWSLVVQTLSATLLSTILLLVSTTWKPQWSFSVRSLKQLWAFSANLTGFRIVNYGARKSDDLLIGRFIGASSLGNYTRAYTLMLLPIEQIISVISRVMFSTLSKIQKDKERVKRVYLKAMNLIAFITFPLMVGLFVVAKPFVFVLFGAKWSGIIPLIQILTWVGIIQSLCNPTGWIYQSQGKTNLMFWWGIFASGIMVTAIIIGVWYGEVKSVAISYALANVVILYPCISIPGRLIGISFGEILKTVAPSFAVSLMMAATVYGSTLVIDNLSMVVSLILQVVIGMLTYVFLAYIFELRAFLELKKITFEYVEIFKRKYL